MTERVQAVSRAMRSATPSPGSVRLATSVLRVLPDFIVIGTQKGGTSSMYQYLTQHPDVLPACKKEVHYFGWEYGRGESWYRAHFPLRARAALATALGRPRPLTGEATPYYLFHPHVPARVKALVPDARFVVLLRNPVDRAISSYKHQVRQGRETLPLMEALRSENERLLREDERMAREPLYNSEAHRHFSYVRRGHYAEQLAAWFGNFPREQFLILRSEDFFADTDDAFQRVLAFLGLPMWRPPRFDRFNVARQAPVDNDDGAARRYLAEYYAPHNQRLGELLGRDLGWTQS